MTKEQFGDDIKKFAINIIGLATNLPETNSGRMLGEKLIDAGMNIAFLSRRAVLARSKFDFIGKLDDIEKAADNCIFLLDSVADCQMISRSCVNPLIDRANFISALVVLTRNNNKLDNDRLLDQVMIDISE
jgi:proline dehydrogenase